MSEQVGDICEKGILKGFYRKGFTPAKCLNELIGNVYDALDALPDINYANNQQLLFDVKRDKIRMIDNGSGMARDQLRSMWSLHKENHANDESRGVSGVGVKPATLMLSDETVVNVYTRSTNSEYLCCTVPWDLIKSTGIYSNMISLREMTEQERELFIKERHESKMVHNNGEIIGTTFVFNTNDVLENTIKNAFEPVSAGNAMNPLDRPSVVFGMNKNKTVRMNHYEKGITTMKMYDTIYSGETSDYLGGVDEQLIIQYHNTENAEDVFVWETKEGAQLYLRKNGRGYSTQLSKATISRSHKKVQEYQARTVIPYEKDLFEDKDKSLSAANYEFNYNKRDVLDADAFLYNTKLVRNGMAIGTLPVPDKALSSIRADWKARMFGLAQQILTYRTNSVQDTEQNISDKTMNIQENKNQHDGESVSKQLRRLLQHIRQTHVDKAIKIIENKFKAVEQPESPAEQPESPAEQPQSLVEEPTPHDVSAFRRGGVHGHEFRRVLMQLADKLISDRFYTMTDYISCYNQVSKIA